MITRKQYLDGQASHDEYYRQFVSSYICAAVERNIGRERILASTDPHMNDIPLSEWDGVGLGFNSSVIHEKVKACGDFVSLSTLVCIAKAAAKQIKAGL